MLNTYPSYSTCITKIFQNVIQNSGLFKESFQDDINKQIKLISKTEKFIKIEQTSILQFTLDYYFNNL